MVIMKVNNTQTITSSPSASSPSSSLLPPSSTIMNTANNNHSNDSKKSPQQQQNSNNFLDQNSNRNISSSGDGSHQKFSIRNLQSLNGKSTLVDSGETLTTVKTSANMISSKPVLASISIHDSKFISKNEPNNCNYNNINGRNFLHDNTINSNNKTNKKQKDSIINSQNDNDDNGGADIGGVGNENLGEDEDGNGLVMVSARNLSEYEVDEIDEGFNDDETNSNNSGCSNGGGSRRRGVDNNKIRAAAIVTNGNNNTKPSNTNNISAAISKTIKRHEEHRQQQQPQPQQQQQQVDVETCSASSSSSSSDNNSCFCDCCNGGGNGNLSSIDGDKIHEDEDDNDGLNDPGSKTDLINERGLLLEVTTNTANANTNLRSSSTSKFLNKFNVNQNQGYNRQRLHHFDVYEIQPLELQQQQRQQQDQRQKLYQQKDSCSSNNIIATTIMENDDTTNNDNNINSNNNNHTINQSLLKKFQQQQYHSNDFNDAKLLIKAQNGSIRGKRNNVRETIQQYTKMVELSNNSNYNISRNYLEEEQNKCVLYVTSLAIIRQTFTESKALESILDNHFIDFEVRDVYINDQFRRELLERLDGKLLVPALFLDGKLLGSFVEIEKLNESGQLVRMLERFRRTLDNTNNNEENNQHNIIIDHLTTADTMTTMTLEANSSSSTPTLNYADPSGLQTVITNNNNYNPNHNNNNNNNKIVNDGGNCHGNSNVSNDCGGGMVVILHPNLKTIVQNGSNQNSVGVIGNNRIIHRSANILSNVVLKENCPRCGNKRFVNCIRCHGSGKCIVHHFAGCTVSLKCTQCDRSGLIRCPNCCDNNNNANNNSINKMITQQKDVKSYQQQNHHHNHHNNYHQSEKNIIIKPSNCTVTTKSSSAINSLNSINKKPGKDHKTGQTKL